METILYQDDTVRINRDQITIIQYFFPIPMDKTIKMRDVQCVGLKTDIDKNKKYIQVIVKGFSLNATFSPQDPNKVMALIQTYSALARGNLDLGPKQEKIHHKPAQKKQIKTEIPKTQTSTFHKQDVRNIQPTAQDAKKSNEQYQNIGVLGSVTSTISHGWQAVKEGAHNIYQATTQKIHDLTTPLQTQHKQSQAKQDLKQGAQTMKEGAKQAKEQTGKKLEETKDQTQRKLKQGKQQAKGVYQTAKQKVSQGWENVKEGASNVYDTAAKKTQDIVGTDAKNKALSAKQNFQQGFSDTGESVKKGTGYEGSNLQKGKQNIAQGVQNTKQSFQKGYDQATKKLSDLSLEAKNKTGQKTKQTGQALKQKGNQMQY